MSRRYAIALCALAGCSNLLGFSAPREAVDAPRADAPHTIDGAPVDAGPATIHVVTGGTAGSNAGVITSDPAGISCPGTCDATFPPHTQITLTATTVANVTFTGFHGGDCAGSAATCEFTAGSDATVFARYFVDENILFTSSTQQAGGGFDVVGNADALCDQLAGSAGLPGNYIAWLSTETPAATRVELGAPPGLNPATWLRPDGELVTGGDASALAVGLIDFAPRLDELGRDVGDDALAVTDTTATGSANSGSHCSDWASTMDTGLVLAGEPGGGTGRWTAATSIACDAPAHIYCVGANSVRHTAQPPPGVAILFVSEGTLDGSGSVGAADALCRSEANAAGLPNPGDIAMITPGSNAPVASRFVSFIISGPVERPDSTEVAPTLAALLAGSAFESPPNVTANRSFVDVDVRVGGATFASFTTDCSGWTTSAATAFGTTRHAATTNGASAVSLNTSCSQAEHVLCLNFVANTD